MCQPVMSFESVASSAVCQHIDQAQPSQPHRIRMHACLSVRGSLSVCSDWHSGLSAWDRLYLHGLLAWHLASAWPCPIRRLLGQRAQRGYRTEHTQHSQKLPCMYAVACSKHSTLWNSCYCFRCKEYIQAAALVMS